MLYSVIGACDAEACFSHPATRQHRARYPGHVSPRRHQCRSGICSLLLLLAQKMANPQGEARSQTTPQERTVAALQGAPARRATHLEEVGSFLRRPLERETRS